MIILFSLIGGELHLLKFFLTFWRKYIIKRRATLEKKRH